VAGTPRLRACARFALDDYPTACAWSPDGSTLLVGGGAGALLQFHPEAGDSAPVVLGQHAGGVLALDWQAAGAWYASSGQDGRVLLWDSRTGQSRLLHSGDDWSEHLAFSGNGKQLAVARGRLLSVHDMQGAVLATFADRPGSVAALAWRPRSAEVAAVANGGARIHMLGSPPTTLDLPWKGACLTASWSPDGRVLASGLQDGSLHFWYVAAGKQSEMKGYGAKVRHTGWSANSRWLASSADEQIVVWDFGGRGPEGTAPLELRSHTARITQLAFSPQGNLLVSGAGDRRLLAWQPGSSDRPVDADLLGDEIVLLRFARNGALLAVGDRGGTITCYRVER
jgi:WD40 repeat protein